MEKKERKYKKRQINALQEYKGEEEEINNYSTESKNSNSDSQTSEEERSSEDEQINFFLEEVESGNEIGDVTKPVDELFDIPDLVTDSDSGSDNEYNDISEESGQGFTEESDGEYSGTIGIQNMVTKEKEEKNTVDYKRPKGKNKIPVDPNLFKKKKGIMQ